ncbi:hypothetical protein Tco_0589164, partial [Tanacetum coccineum]
GDYTPIPQEEIDESLYVYGKKGPQEPDETECLVVSSDFKMLDENQILLKVPRHHNMYSFNMKTPTPTKDFACLIAKATSDESKLWHRRLVKQFWQTATANTIADGTLELHATIDTTGYTITEASIRDKLHLADASGITMLPNNEIFEGMGQMGYPTDGSFTFWKSFFTPQWRFLVHHLLHCISSKSGGWDQFGSNIATALICLSTGRVYNFSKLIFDGMVANLKSKTKFLMYPRFLQLILDIQTENKHPYLAVTLTKKIFGNMKRGFRGVPRPLLPAMLLVTNPNAGQEHPDVAQSQPSSSTIPVPSTSLPPEQSPPPIPTPIPASTPTPIPETDPEPMEHTFEEPSPAHQHFSPPQEHVQGQMTLDDLLQVVPQLMTRVDSLEKDLKQTKLTMGSAIVKLVKKIQRISLTGFPAQSVGSSNTDVLDSPCLLVLITRTSQSRQHASNQSLWKSLSLNLELSRYTSEVLFDVGTRRISIVTMNTKEYHSDCSGKYHNDIA